MRALLMPQSGGVAYRGSSRWKAFTCRCHGRREPADQEHTPSTSCSRRNALNALSGALAVSIATAAGQACGGVAAADDSVAAGGALAAAAQGGVGSRGEPAFTHKVFLDVGVCQSGVNTDRRLGDKTILCPNPENMGRLVIGLYGTVAPRTVEIFLETVRSGAYDYTLFSKVLPGEYVVAGRQGSHRMGYVEAPPGLPSNSDILASASFQLPHRRPGTVSLNMAGNEDEDFLRLGRDYRNTSFIITTGPGPVPRLDGENIVFGQVIEGLDVVSSVAGVPIFSPGSNLKAFNDFAKVLGDDRAGKARATWGKPITPVLIVKAGVLA